MNTHLKRYASLSIQFIAICAVLALLSSHSPAARPATCATQNITTVTNSAEFNQAIANAVPGATILLANGVWQNTELVINTSGTVDAPICVGATTPGKVVLSGESNLSLAGDYLIVSDLVFTNGYSPTKSVISFRHKNTLANHSRVTRTVIDHFNKPDKFDTDYWVAMHGRHNRFDHNHLEGKRNAGVTMAVRLNTKASQQNYHQIDHNYFGPRQILGSNGGETIRIGTSKYSLTNSYTSVINNYFDRANGEVEIISNKSGGNTFEGNVFFESRGTLTLRHGNDNTIKNNVFLGNGQDHTGGIRVINANQTISNNYLEGLTGIRFGGGFVVMNGVPNSPINRYHQVKDTVIENNTLIDVDNINLAAGSDKERSATPQNTTFKHNLVIHSARQPFKLFDDVSGISFENNQSNHPVPVSLSAGFTVDDSGLTRTASGLARQQSKRGASDLTPIEKSQTGVAWYPKPDEKLAFSSGKTHKVNDSESLLRVLPQTQPGDVILLSEGRYSLEKPLIISHRVTLKGESRSNTILYPQRAIMAEIADGGSLQISNLTIDGSQAPDSAGNVLVRNTRLPTLANYAFELISVNVRHLNVNHSAHVFDAGYRSMADEIRIIDSEFSDITGDVLRLDKEQDDLGIYNAEYVVIERSRFTNIGGAIAKIYRGGTDESTFGPHLTFNNNEVINTGGSKRNKYRAGLFLHGVQDTHIEGNAFNNSKPIIIEHTVGEPQTRLVRNTLIDTDLPVVTETFTGGPSTAIVVDNVVK